MTSSGTDTFTLTLAQIITTAYRKCGVLQEDEEPTAGMYADAKIALNSMIKEWDASGIHVWTEEEGILFLQKGQYRYQLGSGSPDHFTSANSWVLFKLLSTGIIGATTIQVESAIGISDGDYIGIVLDTQFTWWTTVNGTPNASTYPNTVTILNALPSTASTGNFGFSYTTPELRPLRIPFARQLQFQGLTITPMTILSRQEYMDLPNKESMGSPTQFFYAPTLGLGELYVWNAPANSMQAARFTWLRQIQDFDNPENTPDLPQEWVNTIVWNLAQEVGPEFEIPEAKWNRIVAMAATKLEMVQGWDREPEPILLQMTYDPTGR